MSRKHDRHTPKQQSMIYYHTHSPDQMTGEMLDHYLKFGWYRIQQKMITTDLIIGEDESLLPVFWIRFDLQKLTPGRSSRKIIKSNSNFTVNVKSFEISRETEELFNAYKTCTDFHLTDTVKDYLLGTDAMNVYDSLQIEIRDQGRLIAVGYFDEGNVSIAGILNFYHPAYSKYSLGKYLMLMKAEFAIKQKKHYYYPGYVCSRNPKFDYKLFPDKAATEVFVRNRQEWVPYSSVELTELENMLVQNSIFGKLGIYRNDKIIAENDFRTQG